MEIALLYEKFKECSGVSTDTRKIVGGELFIALKGPHFNANEFAKTALEKGAKYALISDSAYSVEGCIVVEDTLSALHELAKMHRQQLSIPVFGLTGSNGKTTTKELMAAVLMRKFRVAFTQGNLNNHIGVPLTILSIGQEVEIAIIEMGANHVGEIALLSEIAMPTHGLITNIGRAHIGEFGGFENIIRGKSELYDYLRKTNGQVFVNTNDRVLANMQKRFDNAITYPNEGNTYHVKLEAGNALMKIQSMDGQSVQTQLAGDFNFTNVAAALAVGQYFGVDPVQAAKAVGDYTPQNMRSQIIEQNGMRIMLDAYNANPSSMEAALSYLSDLKVPKKGVVLGGMNELGEETKSAHEKVAHQLLSMDLQFIFLIGENMRYAMPLLPTAQWFAKVEELKKTFNAADLKGFFLLIKGSRSQQLEKLLEE